MNTTYGLQKVRLKTPLFNMQYISIHSCLRDLRNETSVEYIANGIGQCTNLRKLDISFLKCLRDVSLTKDMLHLEELCMDQCQNISPDSALQGLQGHPNLEKLSINLCFQFKSCQLQQLCVSVKKNLNISRQRDVLKSQLQLAERCLNKAAI